jgi:hypothetical protein
MAGKSRYRDNSLTSLAKTLRQVKDLIETLDDNLGGRIEGVEEDVQVLQEALEMNLWVQLKIQYDHTPERMRAECKASGLLDVVRETQQEYLAITAVVRFFTRFVKDTENEEEP